MLNETIEVIKIDKDDLKKELREKVLGYILTALGLVAGLAWNEAIKAMIDYFFPLAGGGIFAKLLYAVIITLIVVVVSYKLVKLVGEKK